MGLIRIEFRGHRGQPSFREASDYANQSSRRLAAARGDGQDEPCLCGKEQYRSCERSGDDPPSRLKVVHIAGISRIELEAADPE